MGDPSVLQVFNAALQSLFTASPQHAKKECMCRVPVFEERIDNIVGIAYAMDLLDYVQKVD